MGYSSWSDASYRSLGASRLASKGVAAFTYDKDIKSGVVEEKVHENLDPKNIKGKREARDSVEHPNSNAIVVFFDVTGSMGQVPVILQQKLPKLMATLLRKGIIDDPQILFGAIGDERSDKVPLQVGQFEAGVEMDEDIDKIYIESGGGSSYEESYCLGMYVLAYKTSIDCFEKRGKKGYAFLIGDEKSYDLHKIAVREVCGDNIQSDIPLKELVDKVQETYELFFIIPNNTSHYHDLSLRKFWTNLLGQHVIMLEDPSLICECIATQIGLCEGTIDSVSDMKDDLGLTDAGVKVLTRAISTKVSGTGLKKVNVDGDLGLAVVGSDVELL